MGTIKLVLEAGTRAEAVFGAVSSEDDLTRRFRELALDLHPDRHPGDADAARAMAALTGLRLVARARLKNGTYGRPSGAVIRAKYSYENVVPLRPGDLADVYTGEVVLDGSPRMAAIKILRSPRDADLLDAEMATLRALWATKDDAARHFSRYLPRPLEVAQVPFGATARRANVVTYARGTVTLADVIASHPKGLDPRDAAWMWRRMLEVLTWVHRQGVVHGSVCPQHFAVRPESHGAKLLDWSYAVKRGGRVPALAAGGDRWAAPEILDKGVASAAADVWSAGKIMAALLGGLEAAPRPIANVIGACLIASPSRRPRDAWQVYEWFDKAIRRLYGPPAFREFRMPATT